MTVPAPQRIDKWLWYARFFKTRSLAAKFVTAGKVRMRTGGTSEKVSKSSQTVREGDVLSFMLGLRVRIIRVVGVGQRRGPATEAQQLYQDLSPAPERKHEKERQLPAVRVPGTGRPTKKERRALDNLRSSDTELSGSD